MREVNGWIYEENLTRVVEYLAGLVDYDWDDLDDGALEAGLPSTNDDLPRHTWFSYPVAGSPMITLAIARGDGGGVLSMVITGEFDEVLAARFETVLDLN